MYYSILSGSPAIERVWMGDSIVEPEVGHRSDPVLGADLVCTIVDNTCDVTLQGPVTSRTVYPHRPDAHYIGIRFRPGVAVATNTASLAELRNGAIPVSSITGIDLQPLADQLLGLRRLEDRGVAMLRVADLAAVSQQYRSPLVVAALERFGGDRQSARIRNVARDLGVTERSLQRHFTRHLGIGPKQAARLVRISRLQSVIDTCGDQGDLASLAVASGFFDQSHMTNEVTRVLGITPKILVDERVGVRR